MKKAGSMWVLEQDTYFPPIFEYTNDKFENEHLDIALKFVNDRRWALDIGAHYGSWTRQMAEEFGFVVAFELRPEIYTCLQKNTDMYSNVQILNVAVGEKRGYVKCKNGEEHFDNIGCNAIDPNPVGDCNIEMVNLDDFTEGMQIDFIKIDVEGYELRVLEGARETLLLNKPIVLLEDNGRSEDFNIPRGSVIQYASSLGMHVKEVLRGRDYILGWDK